MEWPTAFLSRFGSRAPYDDTVAAGPIGFNAGRSLMLGTEPDFLSHQQRFERVWGFPIHDSCWDVLETVRMKTTVPVQALFNICRSFPVQDRTLMWGHDYGVAAAQASTIGDEDAPDTSQDHLCNPEILTTSGPEKLEDLLADDEVFPSAPRGTVNDRFEDLPTEVLLNIFERLSTREVRNLQQASPRCAVVHLPDTFWRACFLPGGEYECVDDLSPVGNMDRLPGCWRLACRFMASHKPRGDLRNRQRIWGLAKGLWDLLDLATESQLEGKAFDTDDLTRGTDPSFGDFGLKYVSSRSLRWDAVVPEELKGPFDKFDRGCRALFGRRMVFPVARDTVHVAVSTVTIFGKRYVSGVRVWSPNKHKGPCMLGYRHVDTKVQLTSVPVRVAALRVALDEGGIRGLAVVDKKGELSGWAGDHEGLAVRKVVPDGGAPGRIIRHLQGGFDVSFRFPVCVVSCAPC